MINKKSIVIALLLIVFFSPILYAQNNFYISGTIKQNISYWDNILDIDPIITNHILTSNKVIAGDPNSIYGLIHWNWKLKEIQNFDIGVIQDFETQLNEVYLGIMLNPNLFMFAGKRRSEWGVAYTHNPIDFFNLPKNPFDTEKNKIGVSLYELEILYPSFSINMAGVMYDSLEHIGGGLKISTFSIIPMIDLHGVFYYSEKEGINGGLALDSVPFSNTGFLPELGINGELVIKTESDLKSMEDPFFRAIGGIRYFFSNFNLFMVGEYYYIGDGYTTKDYTEGIVFTRENAQLGYMSMHNLILTIHKTGLTKYFNPFTDTLSLFGNFLMNLSDYSFFYTFTIESSIIQNCLFSLEWGHYIGEGEITEFGDFSPVDWYITLELEIGY